eukprot:128395-Karenia_brevis.AAC.1
MMTAMLLLRKRHCERANSNLPPTLANVLAQPAMHPAQCQRVVQWFPTEVGQLLRRVAQRKQVGPCETDDLPAAPHSAQVIEKISGELAVVPANAPRAVKEHRNQGAFSASDWQTKQMLGYLSPGHHVFHLQPLPAHPH